MKKLMIILAAALSFNAAAAQNRNGAFNNDRNQQTRVQNNRGNNGRDQWDRNNDRHDQYGRNGQHNRQAEYDRMNRDCDRQVQVYRNDRSLNQYERQRSINEVENQRQQKANAFGKGLVVGGLAAILIGVLVSK